MEQDVNSEDVVDLLQGKIQPTSDKIWEASSGVGAGDTHKSATETTVYETESGIQTRRGDELKVKQL